MIYAMYRFDGEPTKTRPVGMNELVGHGHYLSADRAEYYLFQKRRAELPTKMFHNGANITNFGIYDYTDKLVKVIGV